MQCSEGEEVSSYERMMGFVETSSKDNLNVDQAFVSLAKELKTRYSTGAALDDYYADTDSGQPRFQLRNAATTTLAFASRWPRCCQYS